MSNAENTAEIQDPAAAMIAAIELVQSQVPDEAPECNEPGCVRLGVIPWAVTSAKGTRLSHWCLDHDPAIPWVYDPEAGQWVRCPEENR